MTILSTLTQKELEDIKKYYCDGDTFLYRLNAEFYDYKGKKLSLLSEKEIEMVLSELIVDLKRLPLPPSKIFVSDVGRGIHVSGDWELDFPVNFSSLDDYLALLSNFERYIQIIPFSKGIINTGIISDSPNVFDEYTSRFIRYFGISTKVEKTTLITLEQSNLETATNVYRFDK